MGNRVIVTPGVKNGNGSRRYDGWIIINLHFNSNIVLQTILQVAIYKLHKQFELNAVLSSF